MTATELERAVDKPNKILINYNTVRLAGTKLIYQHIEDHEGAKVSNLLERFATRGGDGEYDEKHVTNCLRFLRTIDMIEKPEERYVRPINRDAHADRSFELKLLAHLRGQDHPQDHLWRLYGVALDNASRTLRLDKLEPEVGRQLDDYEFSWNMTKLRMWRSLMRQVGVVTETDEEGLVLSPCRAMIHELLETHHGQHSNDLYDALDWVEENFLQVFERKVGTPKLHPAISDVVQNLEHDGIISLRSMTDARDAVKVPSSNHSQAPRKIKLYEVEASPDDRPAYRYPLEQERREVVR